MNSRHVLAAVLVLALVLSPEAARAYGGPGSVVSGIGTLLAAIAAVGAAVFGFFWFPVKRLIRSLRDDDDGEGLPEEVGESS